MNHMNRYRLAALSIAGLIMLPTLALADDARVPPSAGMKPPDVSELGPWQRPMPAVRNATLRLGWPRFPTDAEQSAILDRVIGTETARFRKHDKRPASGWATCHFGPDGFAGIYCGMFIKPERGKAKRYRVDVTVWPDGMYRVSRASKGGA